ncbi:hypothetical protein GCM10028771_02820 [Nocardioides marmoraquaticus]
MAGQREDAGGTCDDTRPEASGAPSRVSEPVVETGKGHSPYGKRPCIPRLRWSCGETVLRACRDSNPKPSDLEPAAAAGGAIAPASAALELHVTPADVVELGPRRALSDSRDDLPLRSMATDRHLAVVSSAS